MLIRIAPQPQKPVDLKQTYDAIVVGSGAAGGMAAYVLTRHGLKVLLLEAGRKQNIDSDLRSMEWPYEHERRGDMPPDRHAITGPEYASHPPPYTSSGKYKHVHSYVQSWSGADYSKDLVVDENEHPYSGTNYAWVRSRVLGGKTNIWGRLALRLSDFDFKAASRDGYGENWPISYADIAPYYDKTDLLLGISGHRENLPHLPDSLFQRPFKLTDSEMGLRRSLAKMGRTLTPYRAGVMTEKLKHAKYRSHCFGRGACNRRVGGCDIHAAFDSPTGLLLPANDTGNLTIRTNSTCSEVLVNPRTGLASGVRFIDSETMKSYDAHARTVVLAASTLESARLLLLSKSRLHPNGIGNSSGHVGHNFCEHVMGPEITGLVKERIGKPRRNDDGRPGGFYVARFRNLNEKNPRFLRGYGFEGSSGDEIFPYTNYKGFGRSFKKQIREKSGAYISMGAFGEVLSRYENFVELDPGLKDKWGIPVLKFNYKFGDNEQAMCRDMVESAREMFTEAGIEIVDVTSEPLTEGWSIHELGTARMGTDPKKSVLNQFQQSHDVKNLFVVDGSSHVSAANQNPTWTIMALAWRSCDYLAAELKRGRL